VETSALIASLWQSCYRVNRWSVICFGLTGALGATPAVHAAAAQDKTAVAQRLFREGRGLLKAHDYERACAVFAQSAELDARVGTLASLGECEEGRGRLASAWSAWQKALYAAQAANDRRLEAVRRDFERIDERVPKLTIQAPSAPAGIRILVDQSIPLNAASLGIPFPVNAGVHTVSAVAPGKVAWSTRVDAPTEGSQATVVIPPLVAETSAAPAALPTSPAAAQALVSREPVAPASVESDRADSPLRAVGVAVAVVGLVGAGGAAYAWWGYERRHCKAGQHRRLFRARSDDLPVNRRKSRGTISP
jgi:hypothetical protein